VAPARFEENVIFTQIDETPDADRMLNHVALESRDISVRRTVASLCSLDILGSVKHAARINALVPKTVAVSC